MSNRKRPPLQVCYTRVNDDLTRSSTRICVEEVMRIGNNILHGVVGNDIKFSCPVEDIHWIRPTPKKGQL